MKQKITKIELKHVVIVLLAYLGLFMLLDPLQTLMASIVGPNLYIQAAVGSAILLLLAYTTNLLKCI